MTTETVPIPQKSQSQPPAVQQQPAPMDALETALITGDLSKLTPPQRVSYYMSRCEAAGLDPKTQPFQYMMLDGRLTLYAGKNTAQQLAANHAISHAITDQKTVDGVRVVQVHAVRPSKFPDMKQECDEIGCVYVEGMKGKELANAMMKAVTKAKSRATFALVGLSMPDESELESMDAAIVAVDPETGEQRG